MPLAAPIGSGLGVCNPYSIAIIKERAKVPVIVDAGVGTASDAAIAMELGVDGLLMNTGIAAAQDPEAHGVRDARRGQRRAQRVSRRPDAEAALCERVEPRHRSHRHSPRLTGVRTIVTEISVSELAAKHNAGEDFILLDVREPDELAIASIPWAMAIPMGDVPVRYGRIAERQADRGDVPRRHAQRPRH